MYNEFESEAKPIEFWQSRVQAPRIKHKRKKNLKRQVVLCHGVVINESYWIVQGNCVIQRDPDLCKRRELEWFSRVAWIVWMTLSELIRK
jgi:hypothetical protein